MKGPSRLYLALIVQVLGIGACVEAVPPIGEASAHEIYQFDTLAEMTATSDLVVRATVLDARPGREIGFNESQQGEGRLRFRLVTLDVREVLYEPDPQAPGALPGQLTPRTVLMEELGWEGSVPIIVNDVHPSQVGDVGYYFLSLKQGTGEELYHRLVNSQGRYLLRDGQLIGPNLEGEAGELVDYIETLSPATLELEIDEAKEAIERGEVVSQTVDCCVEE